MILTNENEISNCGIERGWVGKLIYDVLTRYWFMCLAAKLFTIMQEPIQTNIFDYRNNIQSQNRIYYNDAINRLVRDDKFFHVTDLNPR